jgi:hypothetical protein
VAAAVAGVVAVAGCGGDSDGKSNTEKLAVAQAHADVQEFCGVSSTKKGDVYDRAYFALLDAVDTLAAQYKDNPDAKVQLVPNRDAVPVKKVVNDAIRDLKGCGPDGRQQGTRLQQSINTQ